ncbi:glucose-6-phosphate 1-dehydrogenase [Fistulifera solaris]|uniref:Glucose-6-phosphate 1-dehydrogenase n=1 Tax=Fistulifera solaris TaxID=1519565 RepID=A0A1Z5KNP7_FISSO|nr:glucose-6-phosphate 1-dehydrogenase [Fistulifera solaris]|eukprot:GAX27787.1 glucose-6-phosphate 1-dehydrogenase [Fistulifera solaris]
MCDEVIEEEKTWREDYLTILVLGASGDLAQKKTYPSLINLYAWKLLPKNVQIIGLARSEMTNEELRDRLKPHLEDKNGHSKETIDDFLNLCTYQSAPSYGDKETFKSIAKNMEEFETRTPANRLFYFAIPPSVFSETALAIKETCMQEKGKGWSRLIVEKPFGKDLQTFEELNETLSEHFSEEDLYRIDHYLGKELVQNLLILRFSNVWFERVWNTDSIQCVILTFKESIGIEGRGGYFDEYGIIRDIFQNHLLQVLALLAMEPPTMADGPDAGTFIRDAKVKVLRSIKPLTMDDVILGQYEGYADNSTIKNKDSKTATFAALRLFINTPRWHNVPIIMKAGKALNEGKAEMRIQFKDAPAGQFIFQGQACPRNELVMRMQPKEAIYMKTNVKSPGFTSTPIQSELEVNYDSRFEANCNPDAYTRLILDVIRGRHSAFVRDDELRYAWEIFTPLLHEIEKSGVSPIVYKQGSRGPPEADDFIEKKAGYIRNKDYKF